MRKAINAIINKSGNYRVSIMKSTLTQNSNQPINQLKKNNLINNKNILHFKIHQMNKSKTRIKIISQKRKHYQKLDFLKKLHYKITQEYLTTVLSKDFYKFSPTIIICSTHMKIIYKLIYMQIPINIIILQKIQKLYYRN